MVAMEIETAVKARREDGLRAANARANANFVPPPKVAPSGCLCWCGEDAWRKYTKSKDVHDYVLDTRLDLCHPFLVFGRLNFATCFLMCFMAFGWNKCFASSSEVMAFGCFFFGMR